MFAYSYVYVKESFFMMKYSSADIISFVEQNDVKFIRLAFCDVFGRMKNIALLPNELKKAFKHGVPFDISAYFGKNYIMGHELRLFPIENTLSLMPWRPKTGSVVRLLCDIRENDGSISKYDQRHKLKTYVDDCISNGYFCEVGTECEFYLFNRDDNGNPTDIPHDKASYLDTSPLDNCENIRREICITLEEMGLSPRSSRHKYGYGQNEIDFKHGDPVSTADNFLQFKVAVNAIAYQSGLFCSFLPKPIADTMGSSLLINMDMSKNQESLFSFNSSDDIHEKGNQFMAGILDRLPEMTSLLNMNTNSYNRLNQIKLDNSIPDLIRVQPDLDLRRIALCSPDAMCNIYMALNLLLHAGMEGIECKKSLHSVNCKTFNDLPSSFEEALELTNKSQFVKDVIGEDTWKSLKFSLDEIVDLYNSAPDKLKFEHQMYMKYYG